MRTDLGDDPVVYQVYPRSFQDSDGDGEGDLRGVLARLDHIRDLGADALWLSPINPSPFADGGYDVADYTAVDPRFGTLADLDALVAGAHARGLKLLLDLVPCHTSIEHPWFRDHPERYVWSPADGPPNNWRATFGGPAWSADPHGRGWYLHSFYPQQPDLDWRHPDVPAALQDVLAFWTARGVDGFRLDAIDRLRKDEQLRDDPPASRPPALPERPDVAALDPVFSRDRPDVGASVAALRAGAPDAWMVGEAYVPSHRLGPYLEHLDACFCFELLHAPWRPDALRAAIAGAPPRSAWVLSNHDFPRLPDRVGARNARAAALLLLSLPGPAFVYQGDELGMADGPGRTPPDDRAGRDPHRHPMPWAPDAPHAGFTSGDPWLPVVVPAAGTAAEQAQAAGSPLALYRDLIALRRELRGPVEVDASPPQLVTLRRGEHVISLNAGDRPAPAPRVREVLLHTHDVQGPPDLLHPGEGLLGRTC
jgi:alpha-glucosidase